MIKERDDIFTSIWTRRQPVNSVALPFCLVARVAIGIATAKKDREENMLCDKEDSPWNWRSF